MLTPCITLLRMGNATRATERRKTPRDPADVRLGARIRQFRERAQLTQVELAKLAFISDSFVSRIEVGDVTASVPTLHNVARALRLSLAELVDDQPVTPSPEQQLLSFAQEAISQHRGAGVAVRGAGDPADIRLTMTGERVYIPTAWSERARSPLFAVRVSGTALRNGAHPIASGDVVLLQESTDVPNEDQLILAEVAGVHVLGYWHATSDDRVTLLSGDGEVLARARVSDCHVMGVYFNRYSEPV